MSDKGDKQKTPMTKDDSQRIQSSQSKKNDGKATDFSKRAQSTADKNDSGNN